jgi:hypothetical protein
VLGIVALHATERYSSARENNGLSTNMSTGGLNFTAFTVAFSFD